MNTNDFFALRKRVAELEKKMQEMIDYINRKEGIIDYRVSNLESKINGQGYSPLDMSKAEYR